MDEDLGFPSQGFRKLVTVPLVLIEMCFVQGLSGQWLPFSLAVSTEPLNVVRAFLWSPVNDVS